MLLFLLPMGLQAQWASDTIEVSERELEKALLEIARAVRMEEEQQMVGSSPNWRNEERMDRIERMLYGLAGTLGYLPSGESGRNLIVLPRGGSSAYPLSQGFASQQDYDPQLLRQIDLLQQQLALLENRTLEGAEEMETAGVDSTLLRLQSLRAEVEQIQKDRAEQSHLMAVENRRADSLFRAFEREDLGGAKSAGDLLAKQESERLLRERLASLYQRQLFFPVASDKLSSEAVSALGEVAAVLKNEPGMNVLLTGYASPEGKGEYNRALARRRAEAAAAKLRQMGIASSRIRLVSEGVDELSDMKTYGRRVDVGLE